MRAGLRVALAILALGAPPLEAQLISPGKLAAPHVELEGIRNCTRCHELGRRGVARELCLDCHTPLAVRLERDEGFHSTLAVQDCASCHKDHFGVDFALVKLDTLAFEHERTGYPLDGAHGEAGCRDCHAPARVVDPVVLRAKGERGALERTFLGLATGCGDCHVADDPHEGAFAGSVCTDCHTQTEWVGAVGFDHGATAYPLTGRHRDLSCDGCHTGLPRRPAGAGWGPGVELRFEAGAFGVCDDCHADPHAGAMDGNCATCHVTTGWSRVDRGRVASRFDHRTTGFALVGRHDALDCGDCHDPRRRSPFDGIDLSFDRASLGHAFPRPESDRCLSCHVDRHDGLFTARAAGADCSGCHGESAWLPADYDWLRHNEEAAFRLEGAHAAVACVDCHETSPGIMDFALGVPSGCASCHSADDPHGGQFLDRSCDGCHGVDAFTPVAVDHGATRFPLDGAHSAVDCAGCHRSESDGRGGVEVRYRPLGTDCRDCHGGAP